MSETYDVDGYVEAGVARAEAAPETDDEECCDEGCQCYQDSEDDGWSTFLNTDNCDHCPECCICTPCLYSKVA